MIGVIFEISTISTIKMKDGQQRDRLNVTVADDSSCSVPITIWGDLAQKTTNMMGLGDVVAFK